MGRWVYTVTQARIHVMVTHGFLRSLARLDLEESAVGRFAEPSDGDGDGAAPARPVNVGETGWPAAVVPLAAVAGGLLLLALRRRRRR